MADKVVQVPGVGNVSFPDTMSDDDIASVISKQVAPNAGLAPPAGPNTDMQTSALGKVYGFVKGFGKESLKGTFGAGGLGQGGTLPPVTDEELSQRQPLSSYLSQSSPLNVVGNTLSGVVDTGKGIAQEAQTSEGQGGLTANALMMLRGAKGAQGNLTPSAQRAGAALQDVKSAAGSVPIDTTAPGNTALQLYELRAKGAYVPQSVTKLVQRLSAPDSPPMTYAEAKDFQSIISRLSADDYQRMAPQTKFLVGKLNADLKGSLSDAADVVGKGQQFQQAMQEYHSAMQLKGWSDAVKANAWKYALGTGTAAAIYKLLNLPSPFDK